VQFNSIILSIYLDRPAKLWAWWWTL